MIILPGELTTIHKLLEILIILNTEFSKVFGYITNERNEHQSYLCFIEIKILFITAAKNVNQAIF